MALLLAIAGLGYNEGKEAREEEAREDPDDLGASPEELESSLDDLDSHFSSVVST